MEGHSLPTLCLYRRTENKRAVQPAASSFTSFFLMILPLTQTPINFWKQFTYHQSIVSQVVHVAVKILRRKHMKMRVHGENLSPGRLHSALEKTQSLSKCACVPQWHSWKSKIEWYFYTISYWNLCQKAFIGSNLQSYFTSRKSPSTTSCL